MALRRSTRRTVIYVLPIMLALIMLIMLTALARAQVPLPAERPEAAPANASATTRRLPATISTTRLNDTGVPVASANTELAAPVVVQQSCEGCDPVFVETATATGTYPMVITATEDISELTQSSGLVAPTIIDALVSQDPNVWDPFEPLGDHLFILTDTVPAGALRVVAEILASEAPDLDIYLGFDENGDGLPQEDEVACAPYVIGSLEYCSIEEPQPGVWWLVVQGFYASGSEADAVQIAWAVIDGNDIDNDYLEVGGPSTVPAGEPVNLDLQYDLSGSNPEPGDVFYGGFSLGSGPGSPSDIDSIVPVDVRYLGGPPQIAVSPTAIEATLAPGGQSQHALTIANTGGERLLNWQIDEDARPLSAPASAHEIVRDGSFELGSPNPFWYEGGDLAPPLCSPDLCGFDYARTGEWWSWFGGWGEANMTWISQSVTIPSSATAVLSFYLRLVGNPVLGAGQLQVLLDGELVAEYGDDDVAVFAWGYRQANVDISAYADGATHELMFVFEEVSGTALVDDVAIEVDVSLGCTIPEELPWLALSAQSGATAPGASDQVDVTLDAGGLSTGTYMATLCIASDDPEMPLVEVPVTLAVGSHLYLPVAFKSSE
jgi:hypothetical protein